MRNEGLICRRRGREPAGGFVNGTAEYTATCNQQDPCPAHDKYSGSGRCFYDAATKAEVIYACQQVLVGVDVKYT